MIKCPLCQKRFGVLTNTHLLRKHGLSPADFDQQFPGQARWSEGSKKRLEGNQHALGHRHSRAFKRRFRSAVSRPRPAEVVERIRETWRKRLQDPEFRRARVELGRRNGLARSKK